MAQHEVDLSGKLILVTGATRGIGRAVAVAAAAAGAEIIITGRTIGALEEVDDEIKAAGSTATIVELDMTDTAAIPRLASAIAGRWGRLDGFVANAAMLAALTPIGHLTPEAWDESVAVNLTGQWHMIRAFDPLLRAAPAGRAFWSRQAPLSEAGRSGRPMRRPRPGSRRWAAHGPVKANRPT